MFSCFGWWASTSQVIKNTPPKGTIVRALYLLLVGGERAAAGSTGDMAMCSSFFVHQTFVKKEGGGQGYLRIKSVPPSVSLSVSSRVDSLLSHEHICYGFKAN